MPEINNTQEDVSVVSENEELKAAFIKFNNSYLERFSSLDSSIKSLNSSIEKLDKEKGVSVVSDKDKKSSNFGYQTTLDIIQKKLFTFKEKLDEINSPIFNSFLKYLESNEDLNKEMNSKLQNIEDGLSEATQGDKKDSGLLDLIFNGIGAVLKKGFEPIKKIIETFAANFFTKGILVRAFGSVLLGLLGAEFAEKLGVPNYWAKPIGYGAAGYGIGSLIGGGIGALAGGVGAIPGQQIGGWIGFGLGAGIGTAKAMDENAEAYAQRDPLQAFKDKVIGGPESLGSGGYEAVIDRMNKEFLGNRKLVDMTVSDVLSMQAEMIRKKGKSPVGKYQITRDTLEDFMNWLSTPEGKKENEKFNITRSSKFNQNLQEIIANWLLVYKIKINEFLTKKFANDEQRNAAADAMIRKIHTRWEGVNPANRINRVDLILLKERLEKQQKPTENNSVSPATPTSPTTKIINATSLNENDDSNRVENFVAEMNKSINATSDIIAAISGKNEDKTITNTTNIEQTPTPGIINFAWHKSNFELTGSSYSNVNA